MTDDTEIDTYQFKLPGRATIHVFRNKGGGITIDQEDWTGDGAGLVSLTVADVPALCRALRAAAKHIRDFPDEEPEPTEPAK